MALHEIMILLVLPILGTGTSLDVRYNEINTDCRVPCIHDVPTEEVHRVRWFQGSRDRDDVFQRDGPAVVWWNIISDPSTTGNYNITDDFSLVIYNISANNEGVFNCYVTRKTGTNPHEYNVKVIAYGKVTSPHISAVQNDTSLRLPSRYNLVRTTVVSVLWYKTKNSEYFKSDDQPIATWPDGERQGGTEAQWEKYYLTNDFSLEIQNVSFENEAVYRIIVDSTEETKPLASDTNVTVYVLPREVPLMQHFIQFNASFINCSVDHVYPLLYPELEFTNNHQSYEIRNGDGTYNTSISGKVPDAFHNTTVECSFPHFNYTGKSSYYIPINYSVEDEAPHPKGKRHTTQHREEDVENTTPEIEPMV